PNPDRLDCGFVLHRDLVRGTQSCAVRAVGQEVLRQPETPVETPAPACLRRGTWNGPRCGRNQTRVVPTWENAVRFGERSKGVRAMVVAKGRCEQVAAGYEEQARWPPSRSLSAIATKTTRFVANSWVRCARQERMPGMTSTTCARASSSMSSSANCAHARC